MKDFKIGDVVTIRRWNDMMSEYGDGYDYINPDQDIYFSFSTLMMGYCGEKFKIYDRFMTTDTWAFDGSDDPQPTYRLISNRGVALPPYFHGWMFEEFEDSYHGIQSSEYQIDFLLT